MIKQYLLSPGPTPIPNEVALAMSETMIHHRTPQFNKVFEEARQGLKALFGTKGDVLMLASSGTEQWKRRYRICSRRATRS